MIAYYLFRLANFIIGKLPYPILHFTAHLIGWLLEHVLRYRRKVIDENLLKCFPSWSARDRKKVRTESYANLAIILLESFRGNLFSDEELRRRYVFTNPEIVQPYFDKGQDIIMVSAHFNNWEWGVLAFNQQLPFQTVGVYKPIKNKKINEYLDQRRTRTGMMLVPITETRKITSPHEPPARMYILVADQSPSNMKHAIWVNFLGRPTPCLHGPEKYAHQMDWPVFFASIHRSKPGYYKVTLHKITDEPVSMEHGEITARFMSILEKDILSSPGSWLWSHKRWKRVKETDPAKSVND